VDGDPPCGISVYVLPESYYQPFIKKANLVVVYRGKSTDVVVAVKPDGVIPGRVLER